MVSDSAAAEALKSEAWAEQPREAQMEMIRFPGRRSRLNRPFFLEGGHVRL